MRRNRRQAARGFTLIEIMVVLVIVGMMAAAIAYNVVGIHNSAQVDEAKLDLRMLKNAVDMYRIQHASLPETLEELVPRQLQHIRNDPWGKSYVYVRTGETFEVVSYGPDKTLGGGDDISTNMLDKA